MPGHAPLPNHLSRAPFSVGAAEAAGVTRGRLRGSDLGVPFHGARIPELAPTGHLIFARAYAATMLPHQFFTHVSAAEIHGLRLPGRLTGSPVVHVGVVTPARLPRGRNVIGHECRARDVTIVRVGGLRTVTPVDAWRQLASICSIEELVVIGDGLVCRKRPVATVDVLAAVVASSDGLRGIQRLRAALDEIRPGTDSPRETQLRLCLVRAGLPEPEVNGVIVDRLGQFLAFGDLVLREWRILIEYDGGQHREDEGQFHRDIDRLDALMAEGWRVIRINKTHLHDRGAIAIARVRAALHAAGWRR